MKLQHLFKAIFPKEKKTCFLYSLIFLLVFSISGCNSLDKDDEDVTSTTGGAGRIGDATEALKLSAKISTVEPKSSATSNPVASLMANFPQLVISPDNLNSDSDYHKDETSTYISDNSLSSLESINVILCYFSQIKYDVMMNQGNYKAQINKIPCETQKADTSDSQEGGGGESEEVKFEMWWVNSYRADNNSPQEVSVWFPYENQSTQDTTEKMVLHMLMVITESPSSSNPYGIFKLDYQAFRADDDNNPSADAWATAVLSAQKSSDTINLNLFWDVNWSFGDQELNYQIGAAVERSSLNSTAIGTTLTPELNYVDKQYIVTNKFTNIAYDEDNFLKSDPSGDVCLDRNDFSESVWQYGLYDSTGSRVNLNTGFSIKATDNAGKEHYGYISHWGLWMPEAANISHGSRVKKLDYGSSSDGEEYEVIKIGGKLRKYTRETTSMASFKNVPLNLNDYSGGSTYYKVMWNGTKLMKTATRTDWNDDWTRIDPSQEFEVDASNDHSLHFYAPSARGSISIQFRNDSGVFLGLSDSTVVRYQTQRVVTPGESVPTLTCLRDCLSATTINTTNPYSGNSRNNWLQDGTPDTVEKYEYTFSDNTLHQNGSPVVLTSGEHQRTLWNGLLFEYEPNKEKLICKWDSGKTCEGHISSELDTYYRWTTGLDYWNQFSTLKDSSGQYLTFDQPLSLRYVHQQSNPAASDYKYDGAEFSLRYGGFGRLWGLPSICIHENTGVEVDCYDDHSRYIHILNIENGANVTLCENGCTEYIVKVLDKMQWMKPDPTGCTGLATESVPLPDSSAFDTFTLGDIPDIDGPPMVIEGELQTP
ncbi:MAG: hypothetical protein GY786_09265 [Proteobacteria bacterium]|nr:hypothetical protein [Pseudomonadota bacterium]